MAYADAAAGLSAYYAEIRRARLLTAQEERTLGEAARGGDRGARNRLVEANLRLVVMIAREFLGRGLAFDDLVSEGNLGLIRAAGRYDPTFGTRFSTYAGHWVREAIRRALRDTTATVRLPAYMVILLTKWRRAERALGRELGHDPGFERVADHLGLTGAQRSMVGNALRAQRVVPAGGDDQNDAAWSEPAGRASSPGAALEAEEERRAARDLLGRLDAREREVLSLRFGLGDERPRTLKEAGNQVGLSREWVRKVELQALAKLGAAWEGGEKSGAEGALGRAVRQQRAGARTVPCWDEVVQTARGVAAGPAFAGQAAAPSA